MKLKNKEERRAWVEDPANWELIGSDEFTRVFRIEVPPYVYIKYTHFRTMANWDVGYKITHSPQWESVSDANIRAYRIIPADGDTPAHFSEQQYSNSQMVDLIKEAKL